MSLKKQEEQLNTILNLSGLIGYWQGTAIGLQYEDDPKVIHERLREAYEISRKWWDLREQSEMLNPDTVKAKLSDIVELERAEK